MPKDIDYAKLKALSKQILECIGDEEEGEDPSLPSPDVAKNDGGVEENEDFLETPESDEKEDGTGDSKKKKSAMAMMTSVLSKKFNRG